MSSPPLNFRCPQCGTGVQLVATGAIACSSCHTAFEAEEGILTLASEVDHRDYPEALVDLVVNVEDRHFWFSSRNEVILWTMRRVIGPLTGRRLLDVGCGTGFVLAALEAAGLSVHGIDMHRAALRVARGRVRGPLIQTDAAVLPFFADLDMVTLFDVIEHIDDDVGALRQARGVLTPGGFVVVTVPAGTDLWTTYDEVSGHKRRYDRASLTDALDRAGLTPRYVGYFNCLPLVAQLLHRRLVSPRASEAHDPVAIVRQALQVPPWPFNALFRVLTRLEAPFRHVPGVRGGSLIAVAQRRDDESAV